MNNNQEEQRIHRIIYSSVNSNDQQSQQQVYYQVQQSPQQVYYQISHRDQQTVQQSANSREIALQNSAQKIMMPKVLVQRNSEGQLVQVNDNQPTQQQQQQAIIEYSYMPQIDQSGQQTQQHLIIQQAQQQQQQQQPIQIQQKQNIYSQAQVMLPQYYQTQPQQSITANIVQQGGKLVMQTSSAQNSAPKIYYRPPQAQQQQQQQQPMQLIQNQAGQIVQINQQQSQAIVNTQKFIPRLLQSVPRLRLQSAPQKVIQMANTNRMKAVGALNSPIRTVIRPASPGQNAQARPATPTNTKTIFMLMPADVQQNNSVVRLPVQQAQKVLQSRALTSSTVSVQPPLPQQQQQQQVAGTSTTTPSTIVVRKNSDCDDLENSITATAISKSSREPPPLVQCPPRQIQHNGKVQQNLVRAPSLPNTANNSMRSPQKLHVVRTGNPQSINLQTRSISQPESERESAKMLVMLNNGEQRLITFTLPKESCTVQELLDQVGINVGDESIECIENHDSKIDYVVKIGNIANKADSFDMARAAENAENHIKQRQQQMVQQRKVQNVKEIAQNVKTEVKVPPKFIEGFLAVCKFCGATGSDHASCERCHRVFQEEPKRIPQKPDGPPQLILQKGKITPTKLTPTEKKNQLEEIQRRHQMSVAISKQNVVQRVVRTTPVNVRNVATRAAKIVRSKKPAVPEIVTLSSDDEDNSDSNQNSSSQTNTALTPKKSFEPEILEDLVADNFVRLNVTEFDENEQNIQASFQCRSVRIGSYKFETPEKVNITTKGIRLVAPSTKSQKESIILDIQHSEIVKVVVHFSKQLCVIFLYNKPSCARYISEQLFMTSQEGNLFTYQPTAREEQYKKIVFLIDNIPEEVKNTILSIYARPVLEEITYKDANDLLFKSATLSQDTSANVESSDKTQNQEIDHRKLFIFPPGRGGIQITTNDYLCLASDQYLNDVIIDFYLKYIQHEILSEDQKSRVHIFSQFFYKRLTTMTREKDQKLTAAEKRWKRVASWTKNVNIFEKDFVIVPINEQSHWFLAIICFPSLKEPRTMDSDQPIKLLPLSKKKKGQETPAAAASVKIGNTTITPLIKKDDTVQIADDGSERDEAEGDESDLDETTNETDEEVIDKGQAVKVPCILIFDSLIGAPRSRVVATLRDYLTCEYKAKYPEVPARSYTKDNLFGSQVKVPQQNNFTDCGLFLLQYVEQFFKDPIKDYRLPIKVLIDWFNHDIVTKKREEIANLIREISNRENSEEISFPEIEFPTKDGVILEQNLPKLPENAFGDSENIINSEETVKNQPPVQVKRVYVSRKRSLETTANNSALGENGGSSGNVTPKTPRLSTK